MSSRTKKSFKPKVPPEKAPSASQPPTVAPAPTASTHFQTTSSKSRDDDRRGSGSKDRQPRLKQERRQREVIEADFVFSASNLQRKAPTVRAPTVSDGGLSRGGEGGGRAKDEVAEVAPTIQHVTRPMADFERMMKGGDYGGRSRAEIEPLAFLKPHTDSAFSAATPKHEKADVIDSSEDSTDASFLSCGATPKVVFESLALQTSGEISLWQLPDQIPKNSTATLCLTRSGRVILRFTKSEEGQECVDFDVNVGVKPGFATDVVTLHGGNGTFYDDVDVKCEHGDVGMCVLGRPSFEGKKLVVMPVMKGLYNRCRESETDMESLPSLNEIL